MGVNYLGAAIFWLYIVAALFFTGLVIYTIVTLPGITNTNTEEHSRNVYTFSILACISFMTLTYNMLDVLITSFLIWQHRYSDPATISLGDIWKWSIESTLFQDFAEALVATTARRYWTHAALIATMSVCLFMGAEGHRRSVPRLGVFFCLSQILPISFTQNLFYLALLRMPPTTREVAAPKEPIFWLLTAYNFCAFIPGSKTGWLMLVIFTARLLLFAPLILSRIRSNEPSSRSSVIDGGEMQQMLRVKAAQVIGIIVAGRMSKPSADTISLQTVQQALFEHPAVSSLGCDLVICILSYGVWFFISRRTRNVGAIAGDKGERL